MYDTLKNVLNIKIINSRHSPETCENNKLLTLYVQINIFLVPIQNVNQWQNKWYKYGMLQTEKLVCLFERQAQQNFKIEPCL